MSAPATSITIPDTMWSTARTGNRANIATATSERAAGTTIVSSEATSAAIPGVEITLLDTGDWYGMGHNELLIHEALRSRNREQAVISVKFGVLRDPSGQVLGTDSRPAAVKTFLAYTLPTLLPVVSFFMGLAARSRILSLEARISSLEDDLAVMQRGDRIGQRVGSTGADDVEIIVRVVGCSLGDLPLRGACHGGRFFGRAVR